MKHTILNSVPGSTSYGAKSRNKYATIMAWSFLQWERLSYPYNPYFQTRRFEKIWMYSYGYNNHNKECAAWALSCRLLHNLFNCDNLVGFLSSYRPQGFLNVWRQGPGYLMVTKIQNRKKIPNVSRHGVHLKRHCLSSKEKFNIFSRISKPDVLLFFFRHGWMNH